MGLFDFWKADSKQLREKIIFTQKARIISLQEEVKELKKHKAKAEEELRWVRKDTEKKHDKLTDQLIELSNKFADLHGRMLDIADKKRIEKK
ncbi:hypothetical protein GF351_04220 [Candidatus Woesearchaeota archaeon]|nr:hypothetical protein [Candidatus Woesearchaeota archaeon]